MRINHNIAALNTYNKLTANTAATSKSLEKLSSGLKINKAGDNAAGLAISEKMRGQIRGLDQASTNASDAISLINTAEGALSETHSILQRMRELAVQSSNDTNVTIDRDEIQKEMNQLTNEINRIGNTTEFNTKKLLDGGGSKVSGLTVQATTTGGKLGSISTVNTLAASATGKATGSISFNNGTNNLKLTVEAKQLGEDLNGYSFEFIHNSGATTNTVARNVATNKITINANLGTATAATLSTLINSTGVVSKEVNITVADSGGAAFAAALGASGVGELGGKSTASLIGGSASSTRGIYEFELSEAYVNSGATNQFTIRVQNSGSPGGYKDITLTASSGTTDATHFAIGTASNRLTKEQQAANIASALNINGTTTSAYTASSAGSTIVLTERADKISGADVEKISSVGTSAVGVQTYTHSAQKLVDVGGKFTIDGQDILVVDNTSGEYTAQINAGTAIDKSTTSSGQLTNLKDAINNNTTLNTKYGAAAAANTLTLTQKPGQETRELAEMTMSDEAGNGFQANFQIGANTSQSMTIEVADMRSVALKVAGKTGEGSVFAKNGAEAKYTATRNVSDGTTNTPVEFALDVSTHGKATAAISVINDAIESVSAERSKLGSYQNRLEHTINNLGTSSENLTTAESRIRDVDMAKEMMEFTKNNILSQAAQSMLAQANQQPQGVLQLLQ